MLCIGNGEGEGCPFIRLCLGGTGKSGSPHLRLPLGGGTDKSEVNIYFLVGLQILAYCLGCQEERVYLVVVNEHKSLRHWVAIRCKQCEDVYTCF